MHDPQTGPRAVSILSTPLSANTPVSPNVWLYWRVVLLAVVVAVPVVVVVVGMRGV